VGGALPLPFYYSASFIHAHFVGDALFLAGQEDFCQLSGRSEETHGGNYKYDASYEELASLVRRFCPSSAVENPKVFFIILFNHLRTL